MKIEDYHGAREARIRLIDARLFLAAVILLSALMLAGWLHTWFVTRPQCEAILAQQEMDLQRADELFAEASEMLEEVRK